MSNPDSSVASNLSAIGILALLGGILIMFLFTFKDKSYFNYILYAGFPILIYLLASIINILAQHLSSKSIDVGQAFLGGLPSMGAVYLSLLLSYVSYARIPVASAMAPLFLKTSIDVVANKSDLELDSATSKNATSKNATSKNATSKNATSRNATSRSEIPSRLTSILGSMKPSRRYVGGECCSPKMTLENIENDNPIIMGLSYGFYMSFAICFGGIIGTRIALS